MVSNQSKIHARQRAEGPLVAGSPKSKIDSLGLCLLIFGPRLLNLDIFLTADEPLFLKQARDFAAGLTSGDLSQTLGIGYPGVTVAWWSAAVVELAQTELGAYAAGRVVTALATGLLLLLIYALARDLLGHWPAWIGVSLLALDPYTLAYSRLLHIEAPLALFMTLAGLAYIRWLRDQGRRWLRLAGLLTGLALLTKSTALLLGPMLLVMIIGWSISTAQWRERQWWRTQLFGLIELIGIAGATFFVLWPAMWSQPGQALALTFGKLLVDQEAGAGNLGLFWLGRFVEDPGPAFYPVAFLLKATPWLLIGLGLSLWLVISGWLALAKPWRRGLLTPQTQHLSISLCIWVFALTYLLLMTFASKKSIRYLLPAFPSFYLLAGAAFYQFWPEMKRKLAAWSQMRMTGWKARIFQLFLHFSHARPTGRLRTLTGSPALSSTQWLPSLLILILLVLFTFFYHPYYFTYYNPLLLGWRWAPQTLLVGWGEGLDQAARYLNGQPAGVVSTWYEWLFPVFYQQGQVEAVVPQENLLTADHAVLYVNQVQRDIPSPNMIHYFRTRRQPEYTVRLAGVEYAWVYAGPVAGFRPDPTPHYPLGGDFSGEVRLLGYDLSPQPLSGQPLIVTLYWRALAALSADRFVFVRLVDPEGHIWAKSDSPPVMGLWPTTRWQPDMLIEDAHELPIPAGTPPGVYRLEVGLYDSDSGQPLAASGQPLGQGGGLLLGEVQVGWQALPAEADLPQQTEVRLAPNALLAGYDPPPAVANTGDLLPLRLAWREASPFFSWGATANNWVMFEWRQNNEHLAEQLDPLPWPIEAWGRHALLLSQHDLIVPPALLSGRYDLVVMLHTGSDPAGAAFPLGSIEVTAPAHQFELPANLAPLAGDAQLEQGIVLAGYNLELAERTLSLDLYWQTSTPLTTSYKVFAQLLDTNNVLVAQSDSLPAAGQRPTTGWLPEEIISDKHELRLAPDISSGTYRLVAGLYDPVSGERLPVLNEHGEVVADAIFVAEITLP